MRKTPSIKKLYENSKKNVATHLTDSTALMIASTPAFAAFETFVAKMPHDQSLHARYLAVGATFAGMGRLFTGGMDLSRKLFHISQETPEKNKQVHDALYAITYNAIMGPLFYLGAGARDFKQIAIGTACGMGLALFMGGPMGYAVDSYRDFIGINNSTRLPVSIQNKSRSSKLALASILAAASVGLTAGVYELSSYLNRNNNQSQISLGVTK